STPLRRSLLPTVENLLKLFQCSPLLTCEAVAVGAKYLEHRTGRLLDAPSLVHDVRAERLVHFPREFEPEFQLSLTDHLDHPPRTRVLAISRAAGWVADSSDDLDVCNRPANTVTHRLFEIARLHAPVTSRTEGDEVILRVWSALRPRDDVVQVQILCATADVATVAVPFENP